jgi:hypothetical protein
MRANGTQELLPSKLDHIKVEANDLLISDTWGGGGWGDPLERDAEAGGVRRRGRSRHGRGRQALRRRVDEEVGRLRLKLAPAPRNLERHS